ncbi:putative NmrA-like family domain-containing protein 1 [Hyaloscypha variabilis F]|uniref:Putative NmrA-like family domain-containing protein 1 n=1 Tax=Hyaloscypha variabilis (strain UAMH 11265 / GT02V1 / F) TaxID=1149755 RepID=A0A2J6S737_HYAVF|nr:putative NmrA-like family domain-containing protein 1 [Hyaloscypha variabilis F]
MPPLPTSRKILVTGATGKQGGAVIEALIASKAPFQILALTRNASKAQSLASKPNVTVVEGDILNPTAIFEANKPIYGVLSVTVPGKEGAEEAQAKPLIDESIKNGVEHFVFTSVERGGNENSEKNPTNVAHFASKHRIEEYLKENSGNGSKMSYTILRPVAFMDNLSPGFYGKAFASMWGGLGDTPLQLISVHDIGLFGARAFTDPSFKNREIGLAGDELTLSQAQKVFKDTLGQDLPETYGFVGSGIKYMVSEVGTMFKWFKDVGYGVDIQALRKEEPRLQNLSTWLKESSKFPKE